MLVCGVRGLGAYTDLDGKREGTNRVCWGVV